MIGHCITQLNWSCNATGPDGHGLDEPVEKAGILELTAAWLLRFYLCTLDQMVMNWMDRWKSRVTGVDTFVANFGVRSTPTFDSFDIFVIIVSSLLVRDNR